ncbi:unnamed protein product [Rotaria magnacalcarata]|uniref:Phosphotransferase n=4 Tax=Rotaria magnacalcarata TaxID=392030 RepID=A0A816XM57_9BILA|nr:unnamed protein product [Rotaria magnacalcarata]
MTQHFVSMKRKQWKNVNCSNNLFQDFFHRIYNKNLCCSRSNKTDHMKLQRMHNYCEKQGFILNDSTINTIQISFANMITSAFDYGIEENHPDQNRTDIRFQLTHVNALPSRNEKGIFIIIEIGNIIEDVRYNLVSLLGKQIPSYDILHSRGYNLAEEIRKSNGTLLVDQLTIGLEDFLGQISLNDKLPQIIQLGLLVHFPIKQNELNHAEIISWSNRFHCPDLLNCDFLHLFRQSIQRYISNYRIDLTACMQESVAALISVAFEYPNTLISIIFNHTFQLSFVEDTEILRSKNIFQQKELRALYQTILTFNFQFLHSNKSIKSHALFQTLLTSLDINVMRRLNVNYFDIFTCDSCLLEIIRLIIVELCIHENLLPYELWSNSKLIEQGSIDVKFISYLLQGKYSKLKFYLTKLDLKKIKKISLIYMEYICHVVIRRSTQILSCLIACLSDRYNEENLTIAIDSYLYRSCPIYQMYLYHDIEYLRESWIKMFHFINATKKFYLGPAVVMGLQKTQKAMINQDDTISHLYVRAKS